MTSECLLTPRSTFKPPSPRESVKHLEAQANVLARKEFGYLDSWTLYPEFTTNGESYMK